MNKIATRRLDLVPFNAAVLRASIAGDIARACAMTGVNIPMDWAGDGAFLPLRLRQLEENPALESWLVRAMTLRGEGTMVGYLGFHTPPGPQYLEEISRGGIEFGYVVFPEFRRQGYAEEAVLGLIRWARDNHGLSRFVVSISPENGPSLKLAAKLGFQRIGSRLDDEDGPEEILELVFQPRTGNKLFV